MQRSSLFWLGGLLPAAIVVAALGAAPNSAIQQYGRIEGTVVDAAASAVSNVRILVVGTGLTASTGSDGRYALDRVPAGEYEVRAVALGYTSQVQSGVVVEPGKTTTVDFHLTQATVSVESAVVGKVAGAPAMEYAQRDALAMAPQGQPYPWQFGRPPSDREEYGHLVENPFLAVSASPLSTFSVDVDRASYANVRRMLTEGRLPPVDAVRIEEMINYFSYNYAEPTGDDPIAIHTEVARAPWRPTHRLVRIGLQAHRIDTEGLPASNLVFLLDVSGSMMPPNKLPLVQAAFRLLVDQLRPEDRVAIVVYAGAAGLVLPSTPGSHKAEIFEAIDRLAAGGSTAGGAGIQLAYEVAQRHFIRGGNNRVILATDGDFNVGVSNEGGLIRLIEEKRESGVFLTVVSVGEGNLQDRKMEQLADHGNGNYAYIDNMLEAQKVFVQELGGTLYTVAKDVKIQVEFNPTLVQAYRLIGYENRLLRDEEFNDDTKDAGDVGSGHSVTALYEVIPTGVDSDVEIWTPDSLRYQTVTVDPTTASGSELLFVKLRYKDPDGNESRLLTHAVPDRVTAHPSTEFRFQTAVAEFGLLLRQSTYAGNADIADVLDRARSSLGEDENGYRAEFVRLASAARALGLGRVAAR